MSNDRSEPNWESLRTATSEAHAKLDSAILVTRIIESKQSCRRYLEKFRDAYLEIAPGLDWEFFDSQNLPELSLRKNRYEKFAPFSSSVRSRPDPWPRSVGRLYVLEGSVHGSRQLLLKLMEREPSLNREDADFVFLDAFGDRTIEMWKFFTRWLDDLDFSKEELEVAKSAAIETFEVFSKHLGDFR